VQQYEEADWFAVWMVAPYKYGEAPQQFDTLLFRIVETGEALYLEDGWQYCDTVITKGGQYVLHVFWTRESE